MGDSNFPASGNFDRIHRPLGKMLLNNFLGGIAWSLGTLIGATIVLGIIGYFFSRIDFIPIIGKFVADIIQVSQTNLSR